jgi:hypothetical protein
MNKMQELKQLIQNATFLNKNKKNDFLLIIEKISDKEQEGLIQFFQESEEKMKEIHKNYKTKEQNIYKEYLSKIDKDTAAEKKRLIQFFENASNETEENQEEQLIQSIKNL